MVLIRGYNCNVFKLEITITLKGSYAQRNYGI